MTAPTSLIVVCCHGIWKGGPSNGADEEEWLIADFQRGETGTFIEHVKLGVKLLAESYDDSVLAFSGGPTRKETALSEAQSYSNLAAAHNLFDHVFINKPSSKPQTVSKVVSSKILIEDRALDSYHNVLFSLTLFYTRFKAWPLSLTIVSHDFKRPRFIDGHCAAIEFPIERTRFLGIDPPGMINGENKVAMKGVGQAVDEWTADPHGRGEKLAGKRANRNPWAVWQGVFEDEVDGFGKGGLVTRGEGEMEALVDDAPRPW
ncbi:uncharacterized protein TrAtP1_007027 [Trichoderma atroviride]|uniref:DUF218 domain-containing protein n=1 Tax=Hypocrea atroviridis (strain ATCC 20476 / IMI 206040) TaxID=452589 RepID=G9PCC1_HYPAI|nr:uncharacterized protein TRIATDRAFT_231443 [Trichoderma atroviride IMI 206040]EHK39495.1 hypothetical protein TRIATDRAFT_231443 [Trichoderma atroviride IMI 206040]UKZ65837.1 hypothetical protein TrAtP1_007027 [Trichoderma atroviride]